MAHSLSARPPSLERRYRKDRRFRLYGLLAVAVALIFFALITGGIVFRSFQVFQTKEIVLPFTLDEKTYEGFMSRGFKELFPDATEEDLQNLSTLLSLGGQKVFYQARARALKNKISQDSLFFPLSEDALRLPKNQPWVNLLLEKGLIDLRFNTRFFTEADSRNPETAGIWGGVLGSFYLMLMTLFFSFPVGIASAVYLEEFAPKNRFLELIEVNISNLAAVPSIVFGLLGLGIFINLLHLPRSSTLVGGLTLSLMTLPTIIIAARTALAAVPKTIREAAQGLGASRMQVTFHHVVPLALPGILTGTIISMARALGETAPLLMIGMMAFVVDLPRSPWDPATALPVQIFTWARNPEPGFMSSAAGGILVLLGFLVLMNLGAILLRKRFEHKW